MHALRIVHHYYYPRDLIEVFGEVVDVVLLYFRIVGKENNDDDDFFSFAFLSHAVMEGRRRQAQHNMVGEASRIVILLPSSEESF